MKDKEKFEQMMKEEYGRSLNGCVWSFLVVVAVFVLALILYITHK